MEHHVFSRWKKIFFLESDSVKFFFSLQDKKRPGGRGGGYCNTLSGPVFRGVGARHQQAQSCISLCCGKRQMLGYVNAALWWWRLFLYIFYSQTPLNPSLFWQSWISKPLRGCWVRAWTSWRGTSPTTRSSWSTCLEVALKLSNAAHETPQMDYLWVG